MDTNEVNTMPQRYLKIIRLPLNTTIMPISTATIWLFISWIMSYVPDWLLPNRITNYLKWCPTSPATLEAAERKILSHIQGSFKVQYVDVGVIENERCYIWTLIMNLDQETKKIPLVMLHGFASGLGLWIMNLDYLAAERPVYAFDILGFGRSTRPAFDLDAAQVEYKLVESIEKWRLAVGLERFILLGHNMGGFIATAYALQHPNEVAHLILVDPWGFLERPISVSHQYQLPGWVKLVTSLLMSVNPLAGVRIAGPVGPLLVNKLRSDLRKKFIPLIQDTSTISDYIYHCNAQTPSGEVAFKAMTGTDGWAKYPMLCRIGDLDKDVSITFIYGSRSWVNRQPGFQIKYMRLNSFVDVELIQGAGHHVYADKPDQFNNLVSQVCDWVEEREIKF